MVDIRVTFAPNPQFPETLAMSNSFYLSNPDVLFTNTSCQNTQPTLEILTIFRCQMDKVDHLIDPADISVALSRVAINVAVSFTSLIT